MPRNEKNVVLGLALLALAGSVASAAATWGWRLSATNTTGMNANDFHAVFIGTGGSVANIVLTDVPGGDGVASPNAPVAANGIDVVWPTTVVMPGQSITLDFTVDLAAPITLDRAWWTKDGVDIGSPTPGNWSLERYNVPAPGALALLAGGGMLIARRRRR